MRIELTRVGLLVYLANHYTTRGAQFVGTRDGRIFSSANKREEKRKMHYSVNQKKKKRKKRKKKEKKKEQREEKKKKRYLQSL